MKHSSNHGWLMTAVCFLPILLIAGLWMLGFNHTYLMYGILLLCPLSHIIMMRGNRSIPLEK